MVCRAIPEREYGRLGVQPSTQSLSAMRKGLIFSISFDHSKLPKVEFIELHVLPLCFIDCKPASDTESKNRIQRTGHRTFGIGERVQSARQ